MRTILFISIGILLISCEKKHNSGTPVYAGEVNSNMFHYTFDPDLLINFDSDHPDCGTVYGEDSIDIFDDGKYDLFLNSSIFDPASYLQCCQSSHDPYCGPVFFSYTIKCANNFEVASYNDVDYGEAFVDTLNKDQRIDTIQNWKDYVPAWIVSEGSSDAGAIPYMKDYYTYIGIRFKDLNQYKYGWIKIGFGGAAYENTITYFEYAIEK